MATRNCYQATIFSVALAVMLQCSIARAERQEYENLTIEEALQFCAAFEDASERLACFEALAATTTRSAKEKSTDMAETAPDAADAADSATPGLKATPNAVAETASDAGDDAQAEVSQPRFTFVRSNEAKEKRRQRKRYELTVYRAWRNALGELRIAFTNGEIWAQFGRGTRYTPEQGESVVFKPGIVGGWTLSMQRGRYGFRARHINDKD